MTETQTAPDWRTVPIPPRIAGLPRNKVGYPVPWFVAWIDGEPDFRVIREGGTAEAIRFEKCWICGQKLGTYHAFSIGPMCAINRTTAEPPSHRDCAVYAAKVCPFLTVPGMVRREHGLPEDAVEPAGVMIRRNPGVTLIWVTRARAVKMVKHMGRVAAVVQGWNYNYPDGPTGGVLIQLMDPVQTLWFAHGREATRVEAVESIESGLPLLAEQIPEGDPSREGALAEIDRRWTDAQKYLPA